MRAWCISASYSRTSGTCDEQVPRSVATELAVAKATASISSWYSSSASIWNSLAQSSSMRSTEPEDGGTCGSHAQHITWGDGEAGTAATRALAIEG